MRMRIIYLAPVLLFGMLSHTASAQKQIPLYEPNVLFEQGKTLFNNGEYGAALESFSN